MKTSQEGIMKMIVVSLVSLLIMALTCGPAAAWSHAGRWGTESGGGGSWSASGYRGGSATHYYGEGTTVSSASGTTAYAYHLPYYGATYPAYHPPTTVNYYGSGCYNCGGWSTAGAAVGMAAGMAAGTAAASSKTAAASSAYSAGYAAGSTVSPTYAMGAIYATLPAGCRPTNLGGKMYDLCGNTWFQPSYGANGVYYRVVPAP
jgi:hypothetical protein